MYNNVKWHREKALNIVSTACEMLGECSLVRGDQNWHTLDAIIHTGWRSNGTTYHPKNTKSEAWREEHHSMTLFFSVQHWHTSCNWRKDEWENVQRHSWLKKTCRHQPGWWRWNEGERFPNTQARKLLERPSRSPDLNPVNLWKELKLRVDRRNPQTFRIWSVCVEERAKNTPEHHVTSFSIQEVSSPTRAFVQSVE